VGIYLLWTTEKGPQESFGTVGSVKSAKIIKGYTGKSKGFRFVEKPDTAEASAAISAINGKELDLSPLIVQEEDMKCQDCLYWQISDHQRDEGACRRNAPKPAHVATDWLEGALLRVAWPRTKAFEWCGEFRKRDGGQTTKY
jgi:RNA recognition motif-containing protein